MEDTKHSEIKEQTETIQSLQSLKLVDAVEASDESKSNAKSEKQKIEIYLKPTGNAPIMKIQKWKVDCDKPISWIAEFVKKYIGMEPQERLFLYVNQTFAPSPDQIIKNLYECYSTEGKLLLHYCKTPAWG